MPDWTDENVDWYAERYGDDPSVFAVVAAISFDGAEDVLDIGCGTGSALRAMEAHTRGTLTGVDPSERMIGHARVATPDGRVTYRVAGAEELPFADATFDLVSAINSVPHWENADQGLGEVLRVLRPGGRFVIGGEAFTEPETFRGLPYQEALRADGFSVASRALEGGCFTVIAERGAP